MGAFVALWLVGLLDVRGKFVYEIFGLLAEGCKVKWLSAVYVWYGKVFEI